MDINDYKKFAEEKIDQHFEVLKPYMDWEPKFFVDIHTLLYENIKCLMLEASIASITMSNHTLERLLKQALIAHSSLYETDSEEAAMKAHKKYDGQHLKDNIKSCFELKLIEDSDNKILTEYINLIIRNGFSHGQTDLILKDHPKEIKGFKSSFLDPSKIEEVNINRAVFTAIAQLQIEHFAKENALRYFAYVFTLTQKLDKKISKN